MTLDHCTTDDPAHPGRLDSSQRWVLKPASAAAAAAGAAFVLESAGNTGLCVDPTGPSKPPALAPCGKSGMGWRRVAGTGQFQSVGQRACEAPASKGRQCHACLDQPSASAVDLWDCKPASSPKGKANQNFTLVPATSGIVAPGGLCLTATVAAGAGAEAMVYGSASRGRRWTSVRRPASYYFY